MATAYTPILQLALPVTGELQGTWGTVVNDNITSMIEQAIAGLATVSTWTAASHTLTTANGTTDEARCAVLECSGAPGAAATVVCPTFSKVYIIKNSVTGGYAVTLKTSAGTGISVPNGSTALLYCDGTNVVSGATYMATLSTTQVDILAQGDLRLQDTTGGEYVALQAPATIASSYTLTLPVDDGTAGQALITDGSGVLSWSTAASGDVYGPASATDNAVARFDLTTGKLIQNSVVTIADTTGNMAGVGTLGVGAITTSGALTYGGVTLNNAVTGTGNMVLSTSPTLVTPALGTPASGIVTNLTGTASININGTVGATTPAAGTFTTLSASTPLPVGSGGTSATTLTANNVILGNGTSAPLFVAPSTTGNVLTSNGTTWTSAAAAGGFPSGTVIPFFQAAAPTGWTQVTTQNNKSLRVVSSAGGGTGGTVAFTTAFASQNVGATAITTAQMPSHSHGVSDPGHSHSGGDYGHSHSYIEMGGGASIAAGGVYTYYGANTGAANASVYINSNSTGISTVASGSGTTHTHTLDLAVQYVDIILASKN